VTIDPDSAEEAALRGEIAAWMAEHAAPYGLAERHDRMHDDGDFASRARLWQRTLGEGGWGAVQWPVEFGGRGFTPNQARIFREEQSRYALPVGMSMVALTMVGPTLMVHGTPEQQERFLPRIRNGEHLWCQLFSEPDAGSDLASLRTRAERVASKGGVDEWVVHGQKVWTSGAATADWGILLARTDPASKRHDGLTYFVVDMRSPGVEVRPIVQINRARHFNEVLLDGVRLPADAVVGEIGEGWKVARTTLGSERAAIGSMDLGGRVRSVITAAQRNGTDTPELRGDLADVWIRSEVLRLTSERVLAAVRSGGSPGPEASVLKLGLSRIVGRLGDLAMRAGGAEVLLEGEGPDGYGELQDLFLAQWSQKIGGGTEQMQRNMISERVLGLPRDAR
jgi:alkylation response protein AidB-like acyl-CoA dehydrogenase